MAEMTAKRSFSVDRDIRKVSTIDTGVYPDESVFDLAWARIFGSS